MADTQDTPLSPEDEERYWIGTERPLPFLAARWRRKTDLERAELDQCMRTEYQSHEAIDDALRSWLDITSKLRQPSFQEGRDHFLDYNIVACGRALLSSRLFTQHKDYVRQQIIHSLLQEDDTGALHAIACLLLLDGHREEALFTRMINEACFPRMLELLKEKKCGGGDARLHRFLLHLMYEMSRMERLRPDDLRLVDDAFIHHLFGLVELVSDDVDDPYHYPTIRVLVGCPGDPYPRHETTETDRLM
jgi:stress-induced morphogen